MHTRTHRWMLTLVAVLLVGGLSTNANALSCRIGTLAEKIKDANSVVVGELTSVSPRQVEVRITKVLKAGSVVSATTRTITIPISRYTSLGWPGKRGQLVLIFLNAQGRWLCDSPILLK